jgi:hypothetical protein
MNGVKFVGFEIFTAVKPRILVFGILRRVVGYVPPDVARHRRPGSSTVTPRDHQSDYCHSRRTVTQKLTKLMCCNVLATGPKVRGFDPDRGRWIFKGGKNPEHHFLRRGSKAVGPMS